MNSYRNAGLHFLTFQPTLDGDVEPAIGDVTGRVCSGNVNLGHTAVEEAAAWEM